MHCGARHLALCELVKRLVGTCFDTFKAGHGVKAQGELRHLKDSKIYAY